MPTTVGFRLGRGCSAAMIMEFRRVEVVEVDGDGKGKQTGVHDQHSLTRKIVVPLKRHCCIGKIQWRHPVQQTVQRPKVLTMGPDLPLSCVSI